MPKIPWYDFLFCVVFMLCSSVHNFIIQCKIIKNNFAFSMQNLGYNYSVICLLISFVQCSLLYMPKNDVMMLFIYVVTRSTQLVRPVNSGCLLLLRTWSHHYLFRGLCYSAVNMYFILWTVGMVDSLWLLFSIKNIVRIDILSQFFFSDSNIKYCFSTRLL